MFVCEYELNNKNRLKIFHDISFNAVKVEIGKGLVIMPLDNY
jgi:hypothetical protein